MSSGLLDLSPGAIFANQFKVVRPLARGGMGAVYVVEQLGTARERALKLMHPQIAGDEKSIERFQREAQVASKIESDHVVEVVAAGVDAKTATPWLCMELLKGETLADRVEKTGRLPRADVLEVIKQLGHALTAAHAAGIVHRDLKPENIFLAAPRREGVPFTLKVLDFGVAALVADAQGAKTTQGVGSPMWMAPEQTNVGRVTTATDVWALGLIAFYLLTGKTYWRSPNVEGSSITALLVEMMVDAMPPASLRAEELLATGLIPAGFDAWFAQAVDRDPAKRFADARAALPGLIAVLEGAPASPIPATRPAAFEATMPATALPVPTAAPAPGGGGGASRWGAIAVVAVGVIAVGGLAATSRSTPMPPTTIAIAPTTIAPTTVVAAADPEQSDATTAEADDETEDDDAVDDTEDDGAVDDTEDDADDDTEDDDTEDEDADEDADEDDTPPPPRARRAPAASAGAAAARRMLLDACWRDQFEGEAAPASARWTFDFQLDPSGTATNVRITGPNDPVFASFRRCVVMRVGQYRSPEGNDHVALTLP